MMTPVVIDNRSAGAGAGAATAFHPAGRRSLPQQVREAIEEQILTGALGEGDQIVEYQVARQMGISQTPVREALRTLEQDGLVVTLPHRGTFVRRVGRQEASERYSLGSELEAFAARLALPRLTERDFREMGTIIDAMAAAADLARRERSTSGPSERDHGGAAGDPPAAPTTAAGAAFARTVELNVAFHRYLVERAGHRLLLKAWLAVNPLNWRFVTYTRLADPDPVELAERHRQLLDTYRRGDAAAAAAAIHAHIGEVAQHVLPNLPELPDALDHLWIANGSAPAPSPAQRGAPTHGQVLVRK